MLEGLARLHRAWMVGRMSALRSQPLRIQLIGSESTSSPGDEAELASASPPASVSSRASVSPSGSEIGPEVGPEIGIETGCVSEPVFETASRASSGVVWGDIGGCLGVWGKEGGRGVSCDCPGTVA